MYHIGEHYQYPHYDAIDESDGTQAVSPLVWTSSEAERLWCSYVVMPASAPALHELLAS